MISPRQEPTDAACALQASAQIASARVTDCLLRHEAGRLKHIPAFLDYEVTVVNIVNFRCRIPNGRLPTVLAADTAAHFAVINELAAPGIGDRDADQLVLVIVS